jgi:hypothetical protein
MHGTGGGAPRGNKNALKHGDFTAEGLALKKQINALSRIARVGGDRVAARRARKKKAPTPRMRDHAHTLSDFRVPTLSIECQVNEMRKTLILAGALVAIATPALAVDQAKVAVMVAQMRADEQTAIEAADKAEAAEKLVLQAKGRIEAFQLADKVIEQTDIASEADSAWFDQRLALYGPAKCKAGAHTVAWDALARAAEAKLSGADRLAQHPLTRPAASSFCPATRPTSTGRRPAST